MKTFIKTFIFVFTVALLMNISGCSSSESAQRILAEQGYTNIHITGYTLFGCSEDDAYHTGFNAVSPNGTKVTGVVCSGILKSSTIRLN